MNFLYSYYLNYFTKTTTWEDPRLRYRPVASPPQFFSPSSVPSSVAGELIPLQVLTCNPCSLVFNIIKINSQDLTNVRPSPIPSRALSSGPSSVICNHGFIHGSSPARNSAAPASICSSQETSLSIETEQAVSKIGAMFPTVTETHIRTLLKKYYFNFFCFYNIAFEQYATDCLTNIITSNTYTLS